jgi:hypothetical protein
MTARMHPLSRARFPEMITLCDKDFIQHVQWRGVSSTNHLPQLIGPIAEPHRGFLNPMTREGQGKQVWES